MGTAILASRNAGDLPDLAQIPFQSEITVSRGEGRKCGTRDHGGRAVRQKVICAGRISAITNYEQLHRDLDLIASWAPELVIVD